MGQLIAALGVVLVIALVIFLDVRRENMQASDRRRFAHELQARRQARLATLQAMAAPRGQFICTSCSRPSPHDAKKMGAIAAAFDAALQPDAPRIVLCDDCYQAIMGDDPPHLVTVPGDAP